VSDFFVSPKTGNPHFLCVFRRESSSGITEATSIVPAMEGYYNHRAFNDVFTYLGSGGTLCPTLRVDCNPLPELVEDTPRPAHQDE
jgi:hypothetical protein